MVEVVDSPKTTDPWSLLLVELVFEPVFELVFELVLVPVFEPAFELVFEPAVELSSVVDPPDCPV